MMAITAITEPQTSVGQRIKKMKMISCYTALLGAANDKVARN
jgi:hypothetical protein